MTEKEYKRLTRPHRRALRQVLLNFDFFLEDVATLNVYSVESRIKSRKSAVQKSRRLDIPVSELQDLAGLRIVVATRKEVDVVKRFFYREEISDDLEVEKDERVSHSTGYRSTHIVAEYQPRYTRSMHPARIEVQIPTIFEHAFNFISRSWVYKSGRDFSSEWSKKFSSLAENLEEIDKQADELHQSVVESAAESGDEEPLSPFSYQKLIKSEFDERIDLEDAVDMCRHLVDVGFKTNGDVKKFLRNDNIQSLWEEVSQLADKGLERAEWLKTESKETFWSMFGLRYKIARKMLDEAKEESL